MNYNDDELNEYLDDSLNLTDDEKLLSESNNDDELFILNNRTETNE